MVHQKGTSLQGPVYNEEYGFGRFGVLTMIFFLCVCNTSFMGMAKRRISAVFPVPISFLFSLLVRVRVVVLALLLFYNRCTDISCSFKRTWATATATAILTARRLGSVACV